jgi:hypothetical protein
VPSDTHSGAAAAGAATAVDVKVAAEAEAAILVNISRIKRVNVFFGMASSASFLTETQAGEY